MSDIQQLAFTLGRQPSLGEYIAVEFDKQGISPGALETMPIVGQIITGLEFITGGKQSVTVKQPDGSLEQVEVPEEGVRAVECFKSSRKRI